MDEKPIEPKQKWYQTAWKELCIIATIYLIGFFGGFGFLCGIVAFLRLAGK